MQKHLSSVLLYGLVGLFSYSHAASVEDSIKKDIIDAYSYAFGASGSNLDEDLIFAFNPANLSRWNNAVDKAVVFSKKNITLDKELTQIAQFAQEANKTACITLEEWNRMLRKGAGNASMMRQSATILSPILEKLEYFYDVLAARSYKLPGNKKAQDVLKSLVLYIIRLNRTIKMKLQSEDKYKRSAALDSRDNRTASLKALGLPSSATDDQIKSAYKKLALQYHPDRLSGKSKQEQADAAEKFKTISNAHDCLIKGDPNACYEISK